MYHIKLLKAWRIREALLITPYPPEPQLGPLADGSFEDGPVATGTGLNCKDCCGSTQMCCRLGQEGQPS